MKKVQYTPDEITARLREHFSNEKNYCAGIEGNRFHLIAVKGEFIVTPKTVYYHEYGKDFSDSPEQLEAYSRVFVRLLDKPLAQKLAEICGLKRAKNDAVPSLKDKIASHWQKVVQNLSPNEVASQYKAFLGFTEGLFSQFTNIRVTYKPDPQRADIGLLEWFYYTGSGKTFKEGKAKILLEQIDIDILLPEIDAVLAKYSKAIVRETQRTRVA